MSALERVRRAGEEEARGRRRVRRIGDDGVERANELGRQRPAEVVLNARGRERRIRELSLQKGNQPRIDVYDREARDRRRRAVATYKERKRERGQIIVSEQQHAAADECTGLVDREHAPKLRVHRAVALIQLESCGRAAAYDLRELVHERRELVRHDDTAPAAAWARRTAELQAAVCEELAPGRRQLPRPLVRDDRALAELTTDGGDDRDRQLGGPADPPGGDRLESRKRRQHGPDALLPLGETDGSRNLPDDVLRVSQGTDGCSGCSPARRRGARGSCSARCRRRCPRT